MRGFGEEERESVLMVMGTELAPGIVCCASLCGSLGVPHQVTPWEQHRTGGDPVKQVRRLRALVLSECAPIPIPWFESFLWRKKIGVW